MSPLLFALFLDDLVPFLSTRYQGLDELCSITNDLFSDDTIDVYLRSFILLYADDTVVLAEKKEQLQAAIDAMKDFCELNSLQSLQINVNTTKIVVFSKGKTRKIPTIYYGGYLLKTSHSYNYLGILSNYNGSFKVAQKELYDKGAKAMFSLIGKYRKLDLPIDIQIKLFNSLVVKFGVVKAPFYVTNCNCVS